MLAVREGRLGSVDVATGTASQNVRAKAAGLPIPQRTDLAPLGMNVMRHPPESWWYGTSQHLHAKPPAQRHPGLYPARCGPDRVSVSRQQYSRQPVPRQVAHLGFAGAHGIPLAWTPPENQSAQFESASDGIRRQALPAITLGPRARAGGSRRLKAASIKRLPVFASTTGAGTASGAITLKLGAQLAGEILAQAHRPLSVWARRLAA